jgi:hypothetical protein
MAKLRQDSRGNYKARKRLPDDVRAEYGRLHGQCHEAKFFAHKSTKLHEAKQLYGEWLAEVEGHISAIRVRGTGRGRGSSDPYARAEVDRSIAKLWMVASFGNSNPATRWPSKMGKEYKQETGYDLGKVTKAKDVARRPHFTDGQRMLSGPA